MNTFNRSFSIYPNSPVPYKTTDAGLADRFRDNGSVDDKKTYSKALFVNETVEGIYQVDRDMKDYS
jgi:hypothetical protein